jgi:hypothetical protein
MGQNVGGSGSSCHCEDFGFGFVEANAEWSSEGFKSGKEPGEVVVVEEGKGVINEG